MEYEWTCWEFVETKLNVDRHRDGTIHIFRPKPEPPINGDRPTIPEFDALRLSRFEAEWLAESLLKALTT